MFIHWNVPGQGNKTVRLEASPTMSPIDIQHNMESVLKEFRDDLVRAVYAQVAGSRIADENQN